MSSHGRIDAPPDAALMAFRVWWAAFAAGQESALALSEAASEAASRLSAVFGQQSQLGLAWAETVLAAIYRADVPAGRPASIVEHPPSEGQVKISDCMTRQVRIADPNDTIAQAAKLMAQLDAGVLPVGKDDRLIGMITDRDIAIRAVAEGKGSDAKVSEVMNADVRYCFDDQEADDVLRNMGELRLRRMPVLNHNKRLVGIVSLADLAAHARPTGEALGHISRRGGPHSQTAH